MSELQYGHDDARDYEPYFSRHLMAMTAEDLHSKGDIACELAYRDARIAELEEEIKRLRGIVSQLDKVAGAAVRISKDSARSTNWFKLDAALKAAGYLGVGDE
jgi:hypothetical protein